MAKELSVDEAEEIIKCMANHQGCKILEKYEKLGYRSFSQLEGEVIRVTGKSWRDLSKEEYS